MRMVALVVVETWRAWRQWWRRGVCDGGDMVAVMVEVWIAEEVVVVAVVVETWCRRWRRRCMNSTIAENVF